MNAKKQWRAVLGGISAMLLVLFLLNSQLIIGQIIAWINPGGNGDYSLVPDERELQLGADRIIIPQISVEAPLITDMRDTSEPRVQKSLESGVLNFGPTALPGQGNTAIVGHSSNNVWAAGDYKFVFALLDRVKVGEKIYVIYQNKRYVYTVTNTKVVLPSDVSVLMPTDTSQLTLITCTPVGTALKRLVVVAEQTSPEPTTITQQGATIDIPQLPGN